MKYTNFIDEIQGDEERILLSNFYKEMGIIGLIVLIAIII